MTTNVMLLSIHTHRDAHIYGVDVITHTMNVHWNGVAIRDHQSLLFLTNSPFLHTITSTHMLLLSRATSHCYEQHFMHGVDVHGNSDAIRDHQTLPCLLYTSDAADDVLRVDLGGRRIIKKKFFQAEDGIRDTTASRGLEDVYKRQVSDL